jgi:hypothetical protein
VSHIVERYSFNVPTAKTTPTLKYEAVTKNGNCPSECAQCAAHNVSCNGCVRHACMDRNCEGLFCANCATMCYRAKQRIKDVLNLVGGFEINLKDSNDQPIKWNQTFIPAIQKRIGSRIDSKIISIPFYAIFDFSREQPFCTDVKSYFKIKDDVQIIINFYMKDDKICTLFEYMQDGKFIELIKSFQGVSYWHTPCFSIFNLSNSMDQVLNWKRQWWIGDVMRDHGLTVIQECLYSIAKEHHITANIENALEILEKKQIKNIGQCAQLDTSDIPTYCIDVFNFYRKLPDDISLLVTGVSENHFFPIQQYHNNSCYCNYSLQFRR